MSTWEEKGSRLDFDGRDFHERVTRLAREIFDEDCENAPCPSIGWDEAVEAMEKAHKVGEDVAKERADQLARLVQLYKDAIEDIATGRVSGFTAPRDRATAALEAAKAEGLDS